MTDETLPPVVVGRVGHTLRLELNRPKAINALDHAMIGILQEALDRSRDDDTIHTVVLTGRGDRGFCAGGDIVAIYRDATTGGRASVGYWRDEYVLDHTIATYPKPVVAVMDGIVLGGGVGLSGHASHRVVTERSSIGMPETGIGFVPDVGGTWLLARAPGETGTHLGLTAGSIKAADAIGIGMADHYVPSARLEQLLTRLADEEVDAVLAELADDPGPAPLLAQRDWIDSCYAGDDAAEILARLRGHDEEQAGKAGEKLASRSPFAVSVSLAALRAAARADSLADVLVTDLRLTSNLLHSHDFAEGVRAQVVDKDRNPQWRPTSLDQVDPAAVAATFAPIPEGDLVLP